MHCSFICTTYIYVHLYLYSIVYVKLYKLGNFCSLIKTIPPPVLHPTSEKRKGEEVIRLQLLLQYRCFVAGDIMPITPYKSLYCVFSTILIFFFFALEHHNVKSYLWHHFKFLTLMDWVNVLSPNKWIVRSDNVHVKLLHQDANYRTLSTA